MFLMYKLFLYYCCANWCCYHTDRRPPHLLALTTTTSLAEKTSVAATASSDRVEAGDHVSFQCHIQVDPELDHTVTWLKDDHEIDVDNGHYELTHKGE